MCSVTVETGQLCFDLDGYFVLSLKGTSYANRTEYAEHIAVSAVIALGKKNFRQIENKIKQRKCHFKRSRCDITVRVLVLMPLEPVC